MEDVIAQAAGAGLVVVGGVVAAVKTHIDKKKKAEDERQAKRVITIDEFAEKAAKLNEEREAATKELKAVRELESSLIEQIKSIKDRRAELDASRSR